jgi:hypothetical protein
MSVKTKGNSVAALNVQRLSGDYGTSFASPPTLTATEAFEMAIVENTKSGQEATRLYVYENAKWKYVTLTVVA